jgi:Trypsin-like peptidase domain
MFADACDRYAPLVCNVGGGSDREPGVRIGAGCLLSPRHVLTALHLVRPLPAKLSWPVVEKYDGVFRCEVTYEDAREDLAVLTTTDPIAPERGEAPAEFPVLPAGGPLRLGTAVGYITWLKLPKEAGRAWSFHFAASTVSLLLPASNQVGPRYVLGDDVAQKGVTGSAAFTPAGELCGVVVRTLALPADPADKLPRVSTRPVMTGVGGALGAIRDIVGGAVAAL